MKCALLVLAFIVRLAVSAGAISGTEQLVGEYEPVEQRLGWPDGVYALLLDPARKVGWKTWFSGLPNDGERYAFAARTTRDVQRLIDAFAQISDPKRRVTFNPGRGPRGLGDFRPAAKGREWGAVLTISNREVVANANAESARRGEAAPYAPGPTTLEIFLGTADVELLELKLPRGITIGTMDESPMPGRAYPEQRRKIQDFKRPAR